MNFTPQEIKRIEKLRKQQRQWVWTRWIVLANGIMSFACCGLVIYLLHLLLRWGYLSSGLNAMGEKNICIAAALWTYGCFFFSFGTWSLVSVIWKWHGDTDKMLQLRILDEMQRRAESN